VLEKHKNLINDTVFYLNCLQEEKSFIKNENIVVKKWEKFVKNLLNRMKLKEKYGH
jgi:hypothetical protein